MLSPPLGKQPVAGSYSASPSHCSACWAVTVLHCTVRPCSVPAGLGTEQHASTSVQDPEQAAAQPLAWPPT